MERRIAVVGLGYVGLPVAVAFGLRGQVVGFDVNAVRIAELREGLDRTGEVSAERLVAANIAYSSDAADLQRCNEAPSSRTPSSRIYRHFSCRMLSAC